MNNSLLRGVYTLLFSLALPLIMLRLWWRGAKVKGYRQRGWQRLGFFPVSSATPSIWVHAVSVGEVRAVMPLLEWLLETYPETPLVLTTTTPTGYDQAIKLLGNRGVVGHLPYDIPCLLGIFFRRVKPKLGIIMERELWPNLFHVCRQRGIPLMIANARLPERSLQGYQRFSGVIMAMLQGIESIAVVSAEDAARFERLGVSPERLLVTGNLKANMSPAPNPQTGDDPLWARVFNEAKIFYGAKVRIWIAASTHAGEESIILDAHKKIRGDFPASLLILVPRHPERTSVVKVLCEKAGLHVCLHSERGLGFDAQKKTSESPPCQVYLLDTLGELMPFYARAEVAFVGGSLLPEVGGHNVLEPALCQKPVIFGRHVLNFADICQALLEAKGALQVSNADELAQCVMDLFSQPETSHRLCLQASKVLEQYRQALSLHCVMVKQLLEATAID